VTGALCCVCCASSLAARPQGNPHRCCKAFGAPTPKFRVLPVQRSYALHPSACSATCCCRKPLNRRFIVVEGLYANSGDLAPLDQLMPLKRVGGRGLEGAVGSFKVLTAQSEGHEGKGDVCFGGNAVKCAASLCFFGTGAGMLVHRLYCPNPFCRSGTSTAWWWTSLWRWGCWERMGAAPPSTLGWAPKTSRLWGAPWVGAARLQAVAPALRELQGGGI
jgi:hypothetical protein